MNGDDLPWMDLALGEAEKGRGLVEPNPMVGAVVVRDGRVVGLGHHARFGGPHAEVAALQQAGEAARGATLYVTLEPCCHHGKTPPCTEAILRSGLARVVAAMRDPFPKVAGGGLAALRAAGVAVEVGLRAAEAAEINAPYLKRLATGLPYVTAKWAMTLDGKTAAASGDSRWISRKRRARWSTSSGAGWTRSSSASAPSWPTTPSSPPVPRVPDRPSGSCSTAGPHFPAPASSPRPPGTSPSSSPSPKQPRRGRRDTLEALGCEVLVLPGRPRSPSSRCSGNWGVGA